jgi:hypothetical protein
MNCNRSFTSFFVCCLLLTSCATSAPVPRAQTSLQTPVSSALSSSPASSSASSSPALVPTAAPTLMKIAPSRVPAFTPTPDVIDRLPLNQLWFFHQDVVLSFSPTGNVQQLRARVTAVIERNPLPPLLLTQSAVNHFSLIDTQIWKIIPLDIPANAVLQSFVASHDGTYIAIGATFPSTPNQQKAANHLLIVHLATGEMHTVIDGDAIVANNPDSDLGWMEPLMWDHDTLYTVATLSATTIFWRMKVQSTIIKPEVVLVIGETAFPKGWNIATNGTFLAYVSNVYNADLHLRDLHTGNDVVINRGSSPAYALSTDGKKLVFLQVSDNTVAAYDVMLYETERKTTTRLIHNLSTSFDITNGSGAVEWFDDGQRLLLTAQRSSEIVRVAPGGTVINRKTFASDIHHMLDDDQLLVIRKDENYQIFRTAKLQAKDIATIPDSYWPKVVYIP